MQEIILAFVVGIVVGGIFGALKLPIPAPATIAGIAGILGLFCGYIAITRFIN